MGDGRAVIPQPPSSSRYPAPGGIENLGLAPDDKLWAVGEAGTQRWNRWSTFYPLVFEIDPAKLAA